MAQPVALVGMLVVVLATALGAACGKRSSYVPKADAGPVDDDAGPTDDAAFAPCAYDPAAPVDPSSGCDSGFRCLIATRDGRFSPFAPGDARNFGAPSWEDQWTEHRDDGVDVGLCTRVGASAEISACPSGSERKPFGGDLVACIPSCMRSSDCPRDGDVCDMRFTNTEAPRHCVRPCRVDVPDCVRSAIFQRDDGVSHLHLIADDLRGASICDVANGRCAPNVVDGARRAGDPCPTSASCEPGTVCLQGHFLGAEEGAGFCGLPCQPASPANAGSGVGTYPRGSCPVGMACQPGFTLGFGDDLTSETADPYDGFLMVNATDAVFEEGGGFCFSVCETSNDCQAAELVEAQCGVPDAPTLEQDPLPAMSLCLADGARRGE